MAANSLDTCLAAGRDLVVVEPSDLAACHGEYRARYTTSAPQVCHQRNFCTPLAWTGPRHTTTVPLVTRPRTAPSGRRQRAQRLWHGPTDRVGTDDGCMSPRAPTAHSEGWLIVHYGSIPIFGLGNVYDYGDAVATSASLDPTLG